MLVAIVVVALSLVLSGESSKCQSGCRNIAIPSYQCVPTFNFMESFFRFRLAENGKRRVCDRDTVARSLDILCSSQCIPSLPNYLTCNDRFFPRPNAIKSRQNVIESLQLYCSRHADGTFCPVKILDESTGTSPVPQCTPGLPNTCNSNCQESYRNLSSRLGCCGGALFTNSISPLSQFERFFNSCNVTLDSSSCIPASLSMPTSISSPEPKSSPKPASGSGAGVLNLSILLVVTASLLSTIVL